LSLSIIWECRPAAIPSFFDISGLYLSWCRPSATFWRLRVLF
jgi:hypothetical protein